MSLISIKEINRLAIPAIISGIAEPVISLVDTAFVGALGTEALGGVGIATSFFLLLIWILGQTKTAVSAITARHFGENRLLELKRFIPQALIIVLVIGFMVFCVANYFVEPIFKFYKAKGEIMEVCKSYFAIRASGIPIVLCTFTLFGVFRGMQNTSWAMQISIVGAVSNIILDYILIFGLGNSIPAMGVQGAAWASFIAQCIMLILAIVYLHKQTPFRIFYFTFKSHVELKNLFGLSSTLVVRTLALNVAYALAVRFATGYGDAQIAAHTIAMNIWLFSSFFIDGYANAGNALSGRLLGEKNIKLIYPLANKLIKISVKISFGLAFIYLALYPFMAHFFKAEPDVVDLFNSFFWIVIASQPINAISFALDGVFKGMGRGKLLMWNLMISTFIAFIPILYLLDHIGLEMHAVWLAFVGFMLSRACILWIVLKREFKINPPS